LTNWRELKAKLIISPSGKLLGFIISNILSALVLTGLVHSISDLEGNITWSKIFTTWYSLILIILILVYYFYLKAIYNVENDIEKYKDAEYCMAYVRMASLPEFSRNIREQLRKGDHTGLGDTLDVLKKIIGNKGK
jgi:hypothetical protein